VTPIREELSRFGPDRCDSMSVDEARAWCAALARRRGENFSVLSVLVPEDRRGDFAALYGFCRWADDLGDEMGSPERSLELLSWWRSELERCFDGRPRHPVFTALRPTIERRDLPMKPFDDLIRAFEWDQRRSRWPSWNELLESCRLSADPVGRLVLMILGEPRDASRFEPSDRICTALQLTNHWQDVRRDLLERRRIYVPAELSASVSDFESRLERTAQQGFAPDRQFLESFRGVLRECVDRTWTLWLEGEALLDRVDARHRALLWLFCAGGRHVLGQVERIGYETCLVRPKLAKARKAWLVLKALWMSRRARKGGERGAGAVAAIRASGASTAPGAGSIAA